MGTAMVISTAVGVGAKLIGNMIKRAKPKPKIHKGFRTGLVQR